MFELLCVSTHLKSRMIPRLIFDEANYLDLTFIIGNNNRLYTKLFDKRDDFEFYIVNFPFLSNNIPCGELTEKFFPKILWQVSRFGCKVPEVS